MKTFVLLLLVASVSVAQAGDWTLDQMVTKDASGRAIYHSRPVAEKFRNPISDQDEAEIQERFRKIINAQAKQKVAAGNTYFENEKRTYGYLMAQALSERGMEAVKDLQLEDAQASEWHRDTQGIDFFACFTLKHQMRKYFYFGDLLDGKYRQRMFDGAKSWTEKDPMLRHHYAFKQTGPGWGPDQKDSWVDVRTTENLFLMRVTSIYLMAEATGNKETAEHYKKTLLNYAKTLYRIGMGEWDSENYHGHSLAPLTNLYDFAKDEEVKMAAKACLDFMCAIGAVKYYRGGFNGPTKRDYNHAQPFGGSAPNMLWVYFGDSPIANEHWESDEVHLITSAYRPPPAVFNLARKKFDKPVELFASKPSYSATTSLQFESKPEFLETQYIANSYLMGSLASGTQAGPSDVNGFKILVYDEKQGARAIQATPGPDAEFVGSPQYNQGKVSGENRVAQYGNLAIWLVKNGKSPWRWVVPQSAKVSQEGDVTFIECDRTWIAARALGSSVLKRDDEETKRISEGEKAKFPGHQVLVAEGKGGEFCGFAIEVGEKESQKSVADFRKDVLSAQVDSSKVSEGIIQYKAADDKWLGMHWNDNASDLGVWRNGERHDFAAHARWLYSRSGEEPSPIESEWGRGELRVRAGEKEFTCKVDDQGRVSFENR